MQVKDIAGLLAEYKEKVTWDRFAYEYSAPWHLDQWREKRVPGGKNRCIYLLSEPARPSWSISLETNGSNLWYVGKSNNGGSRIWDHFRAEGSMSDFPRKHRWSGIASVPVTIQKAIAEQQCVVYVVALEPTDKRALPSAVEKFILSKLYQRHGQFPILNLED